MSRTLCIALTLWLAGMATATANNFATAAAAATAPFSVSLEIRDPVRIAEPADALSVASADAEAFLKPLEVPEGVMAEWLPADNCATESAAAAGACTVTVVIQ